MDDIRESFSRLKNSFKHRLRGRKHKPDRTGADPTEESVDSSGSLLRPESRTATGGDDGKGRGTSTDGRQVRSRDRSPQPEPVPASGYDDDGQRGKAGVDGGEASQRHSRLDPDVEVAVGSGPGREVEQVYPSPSAPSIPPSGKPDSA